mmetsp:Transcript_50260/g.144867  ORF Transcript_50260/g.144867 Transcript_50260/m.144867 type:complete len:205 (-) Transcript_50260:394-1008(-)
MWGAHADALAQWQTPHVVARLQCEVEADKLDLHLRGRGEATIQQVSRRDRKEVGDLGIARRRDAEMRRARVDDAAASPVLTHVELHAVDPHGQDPHLPIAELRRHDRSKPQRLEYSALVVPAEGDLRLLAVVTIREEDAEVPGSKASADEDHQKGAEAAAHRETAQAEAEDAIKAEGLKRMRGHLYREHEAHLHAQSLSLTGIL